MKNPRQVSLFTNAQSVNDTIPIACLTYTYYQIKS